MTEAFEINASEVEIAAALEDASIPALMLSMLHMSGDTSILDGPIKPGGAYINEYQGYMSEEDKATVRAQAMDIIRNYRDGGCQLPPTPDRATLLRMMNFLVAQDVPEEYLPMMLEEIEIDGVDQRSDAWGDEVPQQSREQHHVLIIGAGMSGILAAIRLQEAGIPFTVIEKNSGVGGTWFENRYPGARVDVSNHLYCYSFEPAHHWTQYFAQQPELQTYFENVADKHRLLDQIHFNTEVVSAIWDEDEQIWQVETRHKQGASRTHRVNSVISAVGQLNRPKLPDVPGIDSFGGQWCHSAEWDDSIDISGKRVALVGAGASAFQIAPAIAEQAGSLTVFQRVPPWMFENPIYHETVPEGMKWCLQHLPCYAKWFRFLLFWCACDGAYDAIVVDPAWPHQDRSVNEMNDFVHQLFSDYIRGQVHDEELLPKVMPDYPPMGRRTLQDNGSWLKALQRDNVDLQAQGISAVTADGITAEDGQAFDADVIIYATGFKTADFLWPMTITGRNGKVLAESWATEPSAYLGVTVPEFPNFYCLFGPGTNLAFGGSLIFNGECQVRYTLECIKLLLQSDSAAIECREEVHSDYQQRFRDLHAKLIWEHPGVNSFYSNAEGKVTLLWPWKIIDMWRWTRAANSDDYQLS
ncbi:NAD(P)/FAD-dependent oxidoreductase [Halioglobus maricola]|uniref:NAD(P)/FAD-dependent oxidoreductase n=1 Tax=Halioglobus maricola TaxID=2601894 RepID=A0A5P9NPN5_9GAMM|nr:NAD(P)/FAD-dependent oxidoreductase [Halioglobus maricola]QFU77415.1 NAD(P)/FAD-dependent oxidoreductase [Halioglobus maricola]